MVQTLKAWRKNDNLGLELFQTKSWGASLLPIRKTLGWTLSADLLLSDRSASLAEEREHE